MDRHNLVVRGERELRGERRGEGERSLESTAVSSCYILVLVCMAASALLAGGARRLEAQGISLELRAGVAGSTAIAQDLIATPQLAQRLGGAFTGSVEALTTPGPVLSIAAATALRRRTAVELTTGWTFTTVKSSDATGRRDVEDIGIAHALLGVRHQVNDWSNLSGGFGAARYFADEGLFADGSGVHPLLELGVGLTTPSIGRRLSLRAAGQFHRFGTTVIRSAGGEDGTVFRVLVQAGMRIGRHP